MNLAYSENSRTNTIPLILIHAFPMDRSMWKYQIDGLNKTIHVLALDTPGFGGSPLLPQSPSMGAYVSSLCSFLDRQNITRAVFGGCSMGGYILFELWRQSPERVAGLVLCDTRAEADSSEVRENRFKSIGAIQEKGNVILVDSMLPKLVAPQTYQNRNDLIEELTQVILAHPKEGIIDAQKAMAIRIDSTETLATISVPTLILVGKEDAFTPPSLMQSIQEKIVHSHMEIIPHAGHLCPLEQPDQVNAILLDFYKKNEWFQDSSATD